MKTLILDGSTNLDPVSAAVLAALVDKLSARGADVERVLVAEKKIANCQGDFFCWVRSPGLCAINDENRAIARSVANSDLLVFLTPVTFGGYSSELKRAVDHLIQNVLPFFTSINGEIHHQRRYRHYPRLLVIGWLPQADKISEAIFHHLVYRNGLNLHAPSVISGVVYTGQVTEDIHQAVEGWLDKVLRRNKPAQVALPAGEMVIPSGSSVRRALLLVGSPRGKNSTSQSLGGYFFEQLATQGVQADTIRLYTILKSETHMRALLEAVDAADLVTLASPLYVDSLPAPVIRVLEEIAEHRRAEHPVSTPRLTAIVNCGFPEAGHNHTAMAIYRNFARLAGFAWGGGLSLGGGEGLVHGLPLNELDGRAAPIKRSLEMAAKALAAGMPIPPEASALMAKPVVPAWLYRLFGKSGWKQQARKYNVQNQVRARPYESV